MLSIHGETMTETLRRMKGINYWGLITGMTPAEVYLLAAICDENVEGRKVSDLYDTCDMQPTAVSRLMNSLEEKGMIVRNTRKGNRRITDVEATDLGRKTNEENRNTMHAYWEQVLADVPKSDVETMLQVLNEIMDSMENVLAERLCGRERDIH